ncbi:MAG: endonuclease/exonuclease/phosphatase family protein [Actinomycetes bacterium]
MLRRTMHMLAAGLVMLGIVVTAPAASAETDVTVMTRNLYLGADVSIALDLLPDMPAAAQFMWDQVTATDFTKRAPALATDVAGTHPHVIGIQEATTWTCRSGLSSDTKTVYDFTQQFLDATAQAGVPYVLASANGSTASNPGYTIPPIPFLTRIHDPATFQPLFGKDDAECGFVIADALAVRADLADKVIAAGTIDYTAKADVVPVLFTIARGNAWADVEIDGTAVRFVTTHLESFWKPDQVPTSATQADELAQQYSATTMPLVVMGDFNSDPRDPRPALDNPGDQPEIGAACPPQSGTDPTCSAYWTMVQHGFSDAGPDPAEPANFSWGASALLAGPDLTRLPEALRMGNPYGFTDRLDYVFVRNGVTVNAAGLVGATWPAADDTWECTTPEQVANTKATAKAMDLPEPQTGICLPTDHAGVVASLHIPTSTARDAAPVRVPAGGGGSTVLWVIAGVLTVIWLGLVIGLVSALRGRSSPRPQQ